MSCKEVSSYLLSLSGHKVASQPSAAHTGDCIQLDNKMTYGNVSHPSSFFFFMHCKFLCGFHIQAILHTGCGSYTQG